MLRTTILFSLKDFGTCLHKVLWQLLYDVACVLRNSFKDPAFSTEQMECFFGFNVFTFWIPKGPLLNEIRSDGKSSKRRRRTVLNYLSMLFHLSRSSSLPLLLLMEVLSGSCRICWARLAWSATKKITLSGRLIVVSILSRYSMPSKHDLLGIC